MWCSSIQKIAKGTEIINQNESGNTFQIIEEGEPYDMKTFKPGEEPILVKEYQIGNYFWELALIKNEPWTTSVLTRLTIDYFLLI